MNFFIGQDFDDLAYLAGQYYRRETTMASTKTAAKLSEERTYGKKKGIALGISAILNKNRLDMYELLERVPMIMEYDVQKVLDKFKHPEDEASQILLELIKLVNGDESLQDAYKELRLKAFRDGKLEFKDLTHDEKLILGQKAEKLREELQALEAVIEE